AENNMASDSYKGKGAIRIWNMGGSEISGSEQREVETLLMHHWVRSSAV
ncbi:hypothetical protein AC249_AIPGENE18358, partial [Exaiptasia diaphana]